MGTRWTAPRLWPGETVVVAATGPSITQEQVDYVRGKTRVIAVNDAYTLAPWADVFFAADGKWWDVHYPRVGKLPGLMVCAQDSVAYPAVNVLRHDGAGTGSKFEDPGVVWGNNSGAEAVHLAWHLGASRIVLLGCDCTRGPEDKAHFFGDHPIGLRSGVNPGPYARGFQLIAGQLAQRGADVVNCSPISILTCFPKVRLEDVL